MKISPVKLTAAVEALKPYLKGPFGDLHRVYMAMAEDEKIEVHTALAEAITVYEQTNEAD